MSAKHESKILSRINTIGDSEVNIDIHELRKKIEPIIRNPHSVIHFPNYRDYDRDIKYSLSSISHWLTRIPTAKRVFTKTDRAFMFCKHTTFDNINDINPLSQQLRIATSYRLSRIASRFPPFYSLAYYTEYGKSSYWSVSHLADIITNKMFAHGIWMMVMINSKTRKSQTVIPAIKAMCDNNWINEYPKQFKNGKYPQLKRNCSNHINTLNKIRKNKNKKLIYSYPIQMRYRDEDQNKHVNTHSYSRYTYECLMMYDKQVKGNKAVIFWMTNLFWKEIRIQNFNHCYVNIWDISMNGNEKIYVGTIDIDETVCKRDGNKIVIDSNRNLDNIEWIHYHGFMAGVVNVEQKQSRL
eukprot:210220_1